MFNLSYARKSSEEKNRQVQSIGDQMEWINRTASEHHITIDRHFEDEKSATEPGRKGFNDMMEFIQKSEEPVTILVWELNRLSRNPIDEGQLRYAFMQGKIEKIITSERVYDKNEDQATFGGKFGSAADYSIKLSKDVLRGMNGKVNNGWRPTLAPMGYRNDPFGLKGNKQVFIDEETWDKWRGLWDLGLTGDYSVPELLQKAHDMGLRTRRGRKLATSTMYKFFNNQFYAGIIKWNGLTVEGAHQPMVTMAEFERMQEIIHRENHGRNRVYENAYAGMIKCVECGGMITADSPKVKKNKGNGKIRVYSYLRCTKKKKTKCHQKYLRVEGLEAQVSQELEQVEIPDKLHGLIFRQLELKHSKANESSIRQRALLQRKLNDTQAMEDTLMQKLLSRVVDDETYKNKQSDLLKEKLRLSQALEEDTRYSNKWLTDIKAVFNFAIEAPKAFQKAGAKGKRRILSRYGSNLSLSDQKLHIQAILPFQRIKSSIKKSELIMEVLEPAKTRIDKQQNSPQEGLELIWSG